MTSSIANLTVQQLRRAAALKERIQALEKDLAKLIGTAAPATPVAAVKKRKTMSKAARARISAAQKERWAKLKANKKADKKADKK